MKRSDVFWFWACVAVAALQGCGGDDDAPGPSSSGFSCEDPPEGWPRSLPTGIFGGTIEGRADPSFILWSPANDELYGAALLIYGPDLASTSRISGYMIVGTAGAGCESDRLLVNTYDYYPGGESNPRRAYTTLAIDPATSSLSGTLRYLDGSGASYRLSGKGLPGSTYDPNYVPGLADITGDWLLSDIHAGAVPLSVAADGTVQGSFDGCAFRGTVTTRGQGMNLFGLELSFAPAAACTQWVQYNPYPGWVLAVPLTGGGEQLLLWFPYQLAIGRG